MFKSKLPKIDVAAYQKFTDTLWESIIDDSYINETPEELEAKYKELMEAIIGAGEKTFWEKVFWENAEKKKGSFELRMQTFLSWYEKKMDRLQQAIEIMERQYSGVSEWLSTYEESIKWIELSDLEWLDQIEFTERQKIIDEQKLTLQRTERRLIDSKGTNLIMTSAYSRYKTSLATAISEIGVARALNAALTTLNVFEKMSTDTQNKLTEGVIESNKNVLTTCQKVITSESAKANSLKLEANTTQSINWLLLWVWTEKQ